MQLATATTTATTTATATATPNSLFPVEIKYGISPPLESTLYMQRIRGFEGSRIRTENVEDVQALALQA